MAAPQYRIDPGIFEYATARQREVLEAVNKHGSMRAASIALGVHNTVAMQTLRAVERKAAIHGYSPQHDLTKKVAPGFLARGHSTLYKRGEPEPLLQWVKTRDDPDQREAIIREAVKAMSADVKGLSPVIKAPKRVLSDILCVYPLGDPHFGLYAWHKEAGDDFDADEARRLTLGAVDRLVQAAPDAETAIILPLGDVFHMDDNTAQTPSHKNQLDVDTRFVKVLRIGIETFRHAILRALQKHSKVIVRFVSGNHDPHAIWALAFSIAAYFDNEPRVTVDLSPSKFWYHRFGRVLIGSTHGDTVKPADLLGVMAADRSEDWGLTKHRYWYTGHIHHQRVYEFPGVVCEAFRTLAAKDAWAAGAGYRAGRDMCCIVHHQEHGEIERHRCDVGMLAA